MGNSGYRGRRVVIQRRGGSNIRVVKRIIHADDAEATKQCVMTGEKNETRVLEFSI